MFIYVGKGMHNRKGGAIYTSFCDDYLEMDVKDTSL